MFIDFIKRHPVPASYGLVFAISLGGCLMAMGPGRILGITPISEAQLPCVYLASLAGPCLVSILLTTLVHGRAGLRVSAMIENVLPVPTRSGTTTKCCRRIAARSSVQANHG